MGKDKMVVECLFKVNPEEWNEMTRYQRAILMCAVGLPWNTKGAMENHVPYTAEEIEERFWNYEPPWYTPEIREHNRLVQEQRRRLHDLTSKVNEDE